MTAKKKPWPNPDGSPKSVEELQEISKNWSSKEWEEYARSTETPQRETLLSEGGLIEEFSNEAKVFAEAREEEEKSSLIKKAMHRELKNLSSEQRRLIHLLFERDLNLTLAAKELGVCRSTVMRNRNRLLEKLRIRILKRIQALDIEKYLRELAA